MDLRIIIIDENDEVLDRVSVATEVSGCVPNSRVLRVWRETIW